MALEFTKDGGVFHAEDLQNVDPLTLESYGELLGSNRCLIFCILVCKNTKRVYLARNIVYMRYTISSAITVYKMKDPSTRSEVMDILYFEVADNPLFSRAVSLEAGPKGRLTTEEDGGSVAHHVYTQDSSRTSLSDGETVVRAVFIGSELDMLHSIELRNKVFKGAEYDFSFLGALLGGLLFLVYFVLSFLFVVCVSYMLLRLVIMI